MKIIYSIIVRSYYFLLLVASTWNNKARMMIMGRKNWKRDIAGHFSNDDKVIWVHCSSLGEFEQGRPVIEDVRRRFKGYKILLTFYSPSGFEKRKNYQGVDYVTYMPFDTAANARKFIDLVPVKMTLFIKYEFWYHFLKSLHSKNIPIYLVSGKFRKNQLFFKWYGKWYSKILALFNHLFVQDDNSKLYLKNVGIENVTVTGDSRFDRVLDIAAKRNDLKLFKQTGASDIFLIAGSTWPADEKIIFQIYKHLKGKLGFVIAPHEPTLQNVKRLCEKFPDHKLFTAYNGEPVDLTSVIIVDTIGHLSSLYKYGNVAYIGGGFGKGIHNILEATASGLPVIFGPNYQKFKEAVDLVSEGAAFQISRSAEAIQIITSFIDDKNLLLLKSEIASSYTQMHKGASGKITNFLYERHMHYLAEAEN